MDFIREQIKEKPINKKRIARQMGLALLSGAVFALAAVMVLLLCMPMLKNAFDEQAGAQGSTEQESESGTDWTDTETETGTEDSGKIENPIPEIDLSLEDYQKLQSQLYQIGAEAGKSIVTVSGVAETEDLLNPNTEATGQAAGVIVQKDNNYLYVLVEKKALADMAGVRVSFADGTTVPATLLKYDGNTGVSILAVEMRQLSASTKASIKIATIGNSYAVHNGDIVIALGSPLGVTHTILTGNVTSIKNKLTTWDHNYGIFTTGIVGSANGSGVLVNTRGEVIGLIMQSADETKEMSTVTAIAISEIKSVIERLVKAQDVPYVGLYVSTVTADLSLKYQLPKGVFIKEVMVDSPAMYAGLQSGDVITHINGESIYVDATYSSKIDMLLPGTTCEITVQRPSADAYIEIKCEVTLGVLQ